MTDQVKPVYQGKIIQLGIESITMPNGVGVELEIVRHPGGAAIVALDSDDRVYLLRQYRHAAGGWLWELPAGKLEAGEAAETTAARELVEEAGLDAARWESLGKLVATPGFCDEIIYLFLARDLNEVQSQPEAHELFELHRIPLDTAIGLVNDGTIYDAKTMVGLMLAAHRLGG
ncbi:MAG TPA: NUDIX hydrolase [Gammaproteobacteria bacterium]|nr:NUDIX hydrolase [Gammaproteobacteria bacterium]